MTGIKERGLRTFWKHERLHREKEKRDEGLAHMDKCRLTEIQKSLNMKYPTMNNSGLGEIQYKGTEL